MQYLDTLEGWLWAVLVAFLLGMVMGELLFIAFLP